MTHRRPTGAAAPSSPTEDARTERSILAGRGEPDESARFPGLRVHRFGDRSVLLLDVVNDDRRGHVCGGHVHWRMPMPADGRFPTVLHSARTAEVHGRVAGTRSYRRLGEGLSITHGADDELVCVVSLGEPPDLELLRSLGGYEDRRMHWLAAEPDIEDEGHLLATLERARELARALRGLAHVESKSVTLYVRDGSAAVVDLRGNESAKRPPARLHERWTRRRYAFAVGVHAVSPALPDLAAHGHVEELLAPFTLSYRESSQIACLGVGVAGELAFAQYAPRFGEKLRYAQGDEKRSKTWFHVLDNRRGRGRAPHAYGTAGKRVIDRESALHGLREFLATGLPGRLEFARGMTPQDRDLGLPLLG